MVLRIRSSLPYRLNYEARWERLARNRAFVRSGHMVQNHTCRATSFPGSLILLRWETRWTRLAETQVAQWDFQNKASRIYHLDLPLFWKSHCATCVLACLTLHNVTGSWEGPIAVVIFVASFQSTFQLVISVLSEATLYWKMYRYSVWIHFGMIDESLVFSFRFFHLPQR